MDLLPRTDAEETVGAAHVERANALRDRGQTSLAVAVYKGAIALLEPGVEAAPGHLQLRDTLASAWTNLGIAWRMADSTHGTARALDCFARAIALREPLLGAGNPWFRYNLAGVLIQQGEALLQVPGAHAGLDALASYDRALGVLAPLPDEAHPAFRYRLALASVHRSSALLSLGRPEALGDAIASFDTAIRLLASAPGDPSHRLLCAVAWAGKAEALARVECWADSEAAAHAAFASAAAEPGPDAATVAVKAALTLCVCAARASTGGGADRPDEAIERAEDGLRIATRWTSDVRVCGMIPDLVSLAADAYARHQPHFVVEFLDDYLPLVGSVTSPTRARGIAVRAVATAIGTLAGRAFPTGDAAEDVLSVFRTLRRKAEELSLPVDLAPAR
jgi:tetratricopeptide (TPR) repeat protein